MGPTGVPTTSKMIANGSPGAFSPLSSPAPPSERTDCTSKLLINPEVVKVRFYIYARLNALYSLICIKQA